jgi:hypothetical protein
LSHLRAGAELLLLLPKRLLNPRLLLLQLPPRNWLGKLPLLI